MITNPTFQRQIKEVANLIKLGDLIFLYVNEVGVKAVGVIMRKGNRVRWDSPPQTCKNPSDIYVLSSKYGEYHIEIN